MQPDLCNFEEDALGKTYDLRLLHRIIPLARPYRVWFTYSLAIVLLMTLLDLTMPYIIKVAIDRYIVPAEERAAPLPGKEGKRAKYLRADLTDAAVTEIVLKNKELFLIEKESAYIRLDALSNLKKADLIVLRKNDLLGVGYAAAIFLAVVCFSYVLNYIQMMIMEYAGQKIMHDLRMRIFMHIQHLPVAFFVKNPIGRLVTRTTNDVQNMHEMFTSVFMFVFKDIFLALGIAIVLLAIDWKLALVSFAVVPMVLFSSYYFARVSRTVYRMLRIKVAEINIRFSEMIQGIKVIKLFSQETENRKKFEKLNHENYLESMKQVHIFALYMPMVELFGSIALALIIYYGGGRVLYETLSLGILAAFITYIKMFFRPIRDMAEKFNIMQDALSSAERIFQILDNESRLRIAAPSAPSSQIDRDTPCKDTDAIGFSDVSFSYVKGELVLKDISFTVQKGESIAIVGPTGAGKTSIISLIMRFYDPDSGVVRINNRDAREIEENLLRSKMALVMQDPFLFSGTIRENIVFAAKTLTPDALEKVLTISNCRFVVDRMKDGIDTVLSEGGGSLSSGERQLISIARAFAKDPEIIIFDEATSYIDSDTEQKIQTALANLKSGRTSVIIAHRLSTVRSADRIIVLNKGRIVEIGSCGELMERKGFYYKLSQF